MAGDAPQENFSFVKKKNKKLQITNLHYIIKHLLKHFVTQLKKPRPHDTINRKRQQ